MVILKYHLQQLMNFTNESPNRIIQLNAKMTEVENRAYCNESCRNHANDEILHN